MFAQESELLSEVPAERGLCQADSGAREGPGRPHSSTGSQERRPPLRDTNTWEHRRGRLSGRSGGQCPFCEVSRAVSRRCPRAVPCAGTAPGSRRACQSLCQERVQPQRQTPQRPGLALPPAPPRPCDVEYAHADLKTMFTSKFVWFI